MADNEERAPQASAEDNFSDLNVDEANKNPQDPAAAAHRRHNLLRAIALIADYSLDNKADGETRHKYKC
jgi:hypothetical protein